MHLHQQDIHPGHPGQFRPITILNADISFSPQATPRKYLRLCGVGAFDVKWPAPRLYERYAALRRTGFHDCSYSAGLIGTTIIGETIKLECFD